MCPPSKLHRFFNGFREDPSSLPVKATCRSAFFAAYRETQCEHLNLFSPEIDKRLKEGPELVSANFVIPYPPGFPIMVPGQVINAERLSSCANFDVKEIHGYASTLGLKLLNPALLQPAKTPDKSAVAAAGNMKSRRASAPLLAAANGRGNHLCIYSRHFSRANTHCFAALTCWIVRVDAQILIQRHGRGMVVTVERENERVVERLACVHTYPSVSLTGDLVFRSTLFCIS